MFILSSANAFNSGKPKILSFGKELNILSPETAEPIRTKLGRNVLWEVLFKDCLQILIPSKTLVAMVMKWNFLVNSLKVFSTGIAGPILK